MHLTDGWVVVIIAVTACLLILSIGIIHIPDDEDEPDYEQENYEKPKVPQAGPRARGGGTGSHRRPGGHRRR